MDNQTPKPNQKLTTTAQTGSPEFSEIQQAADLVNKIFRSLKAIFPAWGAAIKDQDGLNQAKAEWLKGLIENQITSDTQIEAGLASARVHDSPFLPSVGQFIAWCNLATKEQYAPLEACYAELTAFTVAGRKDTHMMTDILYHTVTRNLDYYNYKKIEKEWERIKAFDIAYKATLFQLECGEKLEVPPAPETLIENKSVPTNSHAPEVVKIATETIGDILSMFEDVKPKQKTAADIEDEIKLQRITNE